ncbi:hypothetical protein [Neisseria meningitidis]|uniref:hypothetical protein n=1 Tax=Neisseria meningitidis TaxID=487 RepID=UPI0018675062|nr:hypothetical protein [Neisseria meningitidis]
MFRTESEAGASARNQIFRPGCRGFNRKEENIDFDDGIKKPLLPVRQKKWLRKVMRLLMERNI